ncbi:MAG: DUF364 domain-containing protein [Desulfarculaceae bacterium]
MPEEKKLLQELLENIPSPNLAVEKIAWGGRFVAVQTPAQVGLASTLGAASSVDEQAMLNDLTGSSLGRIASLLLEDSPFLASVGLAALNAGFPYPREGLDLTAGDMLVKLCQGRRVVVVGDFPFTRDLEDVAASLTVIDFRPGHGNKPGQDWEHDLTECQVAAITATALLTRTLAALLVQTCGALKILVGPSTPWAPRLFDLGVDVLAGSMITDGHSVMQAVAEDLPFYLIKRQGVRLSAWAREGLDLDSLRENQSGSA